jgi:hypothetical protein
MTDALPEWLLGLQAVTWRQTGDIALTLQARPGLLAAANPRAVLPARGSITTWRGNYLDYTGAPPATKLAAVQASMPTTDASKHPLPPLAPRQSQAPPALDGTVTPVPSQPGEAAEPGSTLDVNDRVQLAGAASEWGRGFDLSYLSFITGRKSDPYVQSLVDAARSGKVAAVDGDGNPIGSSVWNQHSMREALRRPGVLIMVPDPYHQIDEDTAVEPLFRRDDVLRLDVATEASPTTPGSAQNTPRPPDEEVAEFIKRKQAEWSDAGKKHGRDRLLAEAASHFGVPRKYVLDFWRRKGLGKDRSTIKRR